MSSPSQRTSSLVQPIGLMPRRIMTPSYTPCDSRGSDHGTRRSSSIGAGLLQLHLNDVTELLQAGLDAIHGYGGKTKTEAPAGRHCVEIVNVARLYENAGAGGAALGLARVEHGRSLDPVGRAANGIPGRALRQVAGECTAHCLPAFVEGVRQPAH